MPFFADSRRGDSTPESKSPTTRTETPQKNPQAITPATPDAATPTDTTLSATLAGDNTVWDAMGALLRSGMGDYVHCLTWDNNSWSTVWHWGPQMRRAYVIIAQTAMRASTQGLSLIRINELLSSVVGHPHDWTDDEVDALERALSVVFSDEVVATDA